MKKKLFLLCAVLLSWQCYVQAQLQVNGATITGVGSVNLVPVLFADSLFAVQNTNQPSLFGFRGQFPPEQVVSVELAPFAMAAGENLDFALEGNLGILTNTTIMTWSVQNFVSDSSSITLDNTFANVQMQEVEVYDSAQFVGMFLPSQNLSVIGISGACTIRGVSAGFGSANELYYAIQFDQQVTFWFSDGSTFVGNELVVFSQTTYQQDEIHFTAFDLTADNSFALMWVEDLTVHYNTPVITSVSSASADPGDVITLTGGHFNDVTDVRFWDASLTSQDARFLAQSDSTLELLVPELPNATTLEIVSFENRKDSVACTINPICKPPRELGHYLDRGDSLASVDLFWSQAGNALQYEVRYRPLAGSWTTVTTTAAQLTVDSLPANQGYEWQVKTVCSNGAPETYSGSRFFTTAYTGQTQVQPAVYDGIQDWLTMDDTLPRPSLFDYLDSIGMDPRWVTTLAKELYRDVPSTASSGECYCVEITVVAGPAIQVEPAGGDLNDKPINLFFQDHKEERRRHKRHHIKRYVDALGPALEMSQALYGRDKNLDILDGFSYGAGSPHYSQISVTYLCEKDFAISDCGCEKEVDIDVRYESFNSTRTELGSTPSAVGVKTEEYAYVFAHWQGLSGSASLDSTDILFADYAAFSNTQRSEWSEDAWNDLFSLAGIVGKGIATKTFNSSDIQKVADKLSSLIVTPFVIRQGTQEGQTGLALGNKRTLPLYPNTTLSVAVHAQGSIRSRGDGPFRGGHRWHAGGAIHSNYRLSMVVEPRPVSSDTNCCIQSVARWDSYSMGWMSKSRKTQRRNIATHLTTYHSAQNWPDFPNFQELGVFHLDLDQGKLNRYYHTLAANTCQLKWSGITSTQEEPRNGAGLTWFPNPSAGKFRLALQGRTLTEQDRVTVFNAQGQWVLEQPLTEGMELDLSEQPRGVYLLRMQLGDETIPSRVVIQ